MAGTPIQSFDCKKKGKADVYLSISCLSPLTLIQHRNLDTDFLHSAASRVRKQLHVMYTRYNARGSEEVGGLSGKRQIGGAVGSQMPLPLYVCVCVRL